MQDQWTGISITLRKSAANDCGFEKKSGLGIWVEIMRVYRKSCGLSVMRIEPYLDANVHRSFTHVTVHRCIWAENRTAPRFGEIILEFF